jgi:hypothetical protein
MVVAVFVAVPAHEASDFVCAVDRGGPFCIVGWTVKCLRARNIDQGVHYVPRGDIHVSCCSSKRSIVPGREGCGQASTLGLLSLILIDFTIVCDAPNRQRIRALLTGSWLLVVGG